MFFPDGTMWWWLNDARHRKGGPAVIDFVGFKFFWLYGEYFPLEKNYWKALTSDEEYRKVLKKHKR